LTKISLTEAKQIYREYHDLECFDAYYYCADKARELGVDYMLIYRIVTKKDRYRKIDAY